MTRNDIKPGDVRIFRPGQAVVLATGVWAKREGRKWIRICAALSRRMNPTATVP